jgi:hypothetical protein
VLADRDRRALVTAIRRTAERTLQPPQRPHGAAQPHRHPVAQHRVQLAPGAGQAGADVPPQLVRVDVGQQAAAVVEHALAGDRGAARAATASSRPSARSARTPLAGRYMPVPATSQLASRSITSGASPA